MMRPAEMDADSTDTAKRPPRRPTDDDVSPDNKTLLADIGLPLDRIPIGAMHRKVRVAIGLGLFSKMYEIFLSSTISTTSSTISATLKTQYDLNGATLKLLLASSFLGMFIGAAAPGRLADRIGRRRAFLFNLIWFSLWTKAWTPRDTALGDDGRMPILVEPTIVADVWSSTDQPSIPR